MPLGLGLSLGIAGGSRALLDSDALSFISRAGISPSAQTPTSYDSAASFNGTANQYLSNSSFSQNGSFTLAFWVYPQNTSWVSFIGKGSAGAPPSSNDWIIYANGSSISFTGQTNGTNAVASTLNLNQWNYVVVTYNSSTTVKSIQVNNGTTVSNTNTGSLGFTNTYTGIWIGGQNAGFWTTANITGVGYWNAVLSGTQLTSLYNSGFGLNYAGIQSASLTTNLFAYWGLNQTSLTADSVGSTTLTNTGSVSTTTNGVIASSLVSSRTLINNFVKGVKGLGIWNNMVCWPLRSNQNANGLTAYSLGGLGRYDGSLTGGTIPSWTTAGAVANSSNSYIQTSLPFNYATIGAFSAIGVGNIPSGTNVRLIGTNAATCLLGTTTSSGQYFYTAYDQYGSGINQLTGNVYNQLIHWANITKNSSNGFVGFINNGSGYSSTETTLGNSSGLTLALFGSNGSPAGGVFPFFAFLNTQLSAAQNSSLYSLYKTTLGQGITLP